MSRVTGITRRALPAPEVDSTHDPLSRERAVERFAHEFVPEDSSKPHVASTELQVGVADPGAYRSHSHHSVLGLRPLTISHHAHTILLENERQHFSLPWRF